MTTDVSWPSVSYDGWSATCDTLHGHTQVLGKLAVELAPPEPELQHSALRLTARGWETGVLPAPDGSGAFVVALDLRRHEAVIEHTSGAGEQIPLTPHRSVGEVSREVLAAVGRIAGPVTVNPAPQEVPWDVPLDEDELHATYEPGQVRDYFLAATRAAQVLSAFRAPFRGRSTGVVAWWGSFDLAVSLFSGRPVEPPDGDYILRNSADAEQIAVGWWPGDGRYPKAAFYGYAFPVPENFGHAASAPLADRWNAELGEFILDWDDVRTAPDPRAETQQFLRSVFRHACASCDWEETLVGSLEGTPPPLRPRRGSAAPR